MTKYDLTSPKQTSDLLRKYGLRPQKKLGQNFLCDRNVLNKIVSAGKLTSDTLVLEIGAGLGALTLSLADFSPSVTSIEIDRFLEPPLREVTAQSPNVHLLFADFMRLDLPSLFDQAFGEVRGVVVANIPYYITTPILEKLFAHRYRWRRAVLLMQNEVARRLVAKPDTKDYGSMSVFAQYHAKIEIVGSVPATVFLPPPDITSAIVAMEPHLPGAIEVQNSERMFYIVRSAFGQRRKTLLNALLRAPASFGLGMGMDERPKAEAWLERAGIDGNRRGETLSLEEFGHLSDTAIP